MVRTEYRLEAYATLLSPLIEEAKRDACMFLAPCSANRPRRRPRSRSRSFNVVGNRRDFRIHRSRGRERSRKYQHRANRSWYQKVGQMSRVFQAALRVGNV